MPAPKVFPADLVDQTENTESPAPPQGGYEICEQGDVKSRRGSNRRGGLAIIRKYQSALSA
jgi:hypothetical protein